MDEHRCGCGNSIPPERFALGYKLCVVCGERVAQKKKPYGYMCYGHKTAGAIVVTSKAAVENYKKVSARMNKGSNMGSASRISSSFERA